MTEQLEIDFINCHIHYCEVCGKRLDSNEGTFLSSHTGYAPWTGCTHYWEEEASVSDRVMVGIQAYLDKRNPYPNAIEDPGGF